MAKPKTETPEQGTPEQGTPEQGTPENETPTPTEPMRYTISIYGEKKSETTGKMRRTVAGEVKSNGPTAVAALDDLKAVLGKVAPEKLAKIVEIRIVPETTNGAEPTINL